MNDYNDTLADLYSGLVIRLVKHDTGAASGCLPCYIECRLGKAPKDKGATVLGLGNYIYRRLGLRHQMTPEYRGRGKSTTLRWFMSKDDVEPIRANICKAFGKESMAKIPGYIPHEFQSLIIQDAARGVVPSQRKAG